MLIQSTEHRLSIGILAAKGLFRGTHPVNMVPLLYETF